MAGTDTLCLQQQLQQVNTVVPVCVGKIPGSMVQANMYVFEDVDQVKVK